MSQPNLRQTRVVDPILSKHARGYRRPGNVGKRLFPVAFVPAYGGNVIEFGKESFRLYNTKRAPGSDTKRIDLGYAGKPYAIVAAALEAKVPQERLRDAAEVPGIDLAGRAIDVVLGAMELAHEHDCSLLARNAANYDTDHKIALLGADRWAGANGDPTRDVYVGSESIRGSIGIRPNLGLLSPSAFAACQSNDKILDRLKYTSRDSVTTEMLARLWNLKEVIVGEAVVATGQSDSFGDVWGDDVILAYVAPSGDSGANAEEPSYGYTYAIDGMPAVKQPYWDDRCMSWIYGVSNDATPVLSGMTAGYLIQGAGGQP